MPPLSLVHPPRSTAPVLPQPALALLQAELMALGQILPGLRPLTSHPTAEAAVHDAEFEAEMDNLPL